MVFVFGCSRLVATRCFELGQPVIWLFLSHELQSGVDLPVVVRLTMQPLALSASLLSEKHLQGSSLDPSITSGPTAVARCSRGRCVRRSPGGGGQPRFQRKPPRRWSEGFPEGPPPEEITGFSSCVPFTLFQQCSRLLRPKCAAQSGEKCASSVTSGETFAEQLWEELITHLQILSLIR